MQDQNITVGLRVVTNDLKWGTVRSRNEDGWHTVLTDDGQVNLFDASRLETRHPFGDADPNPADPLERAAARHRGYEIG